MAVLKLVFLLGFSYLVYSSAVQDLTSVTHILNPALFLIYKVDATDFQKYIDPRFQIATFNGHAHIVIYFTNESAYYAATPPTTNSSNQFQGVDIYTIVNYTNVLRREALSAILKNLTAALACEPFAQEPYGCHKMNNESTVSLDNQTEIYSFYSTATILPSRQLAKANVTVHFHSEKSINSDDLTTIGGFYLGRENNQNEIESLYRKGSNVILGLPLIYTARLNGIYYSQVLECTIQHLQSNYIRTIIGSIQGLGNEQHPVACFYAPYGRYNVTAALPLTSVPVP